MNEINRIVKLFTNMHHGDCWIGMNFKIALKGISLTAAQKRLTQQGNSIGMLVAHIIYWRTIVINRLNGTSDAPAFANFALPEAFTEEAWRQLLKDFEITYHLLINTIKQLSDKKLEEHSPKKEQTYYVLLHGCLQHDAYHLGQIMLLKKINS